jgi:hypothetical protein
VGRLCRREVVFVSDSIAVQYATLEQLADSLVLLGIELTDESDLCRSAAYTLATALDGEAGARGAELGHAWAGLVELLGQDAGTVGRSLREAVHSYRVLEAALSDSNLYAGIRVP